MAQTVQPVKSVLSVMYAFIIVCLLIQPLCLPSQYLMRMMNSQCVGYTAGRSYKTLFSCVIGVIAVMSLEVYGKSSLPVSVRQINTLTLM